ncbi:site-2 protease family protein [Streptomyces sp. NPDC048751]|uniref:site-2 protease family protein n=1 Tax=Streptomyces sp. NPDC048751 TaxID=3365591 RepID=UPI0037245D34
MVESGGSGQPRPGNDEAAEHHAGPAAQAADPTHPAPDTPDEEPEDTTAEPEPPTAHGTHRPDDAPQPHHNEQSPAPAAPENHTHTPSPAPDAPEPPRTHKESRPPTTPDNGTTTERPGDGATAGSPGPGDGTTAGRPEGTAPVGGATPGQPGPAERPGPDSDATAERPGPAMPGDGTTTGRPEGTAPDSDATAGRPERPGPEQGVTSGQSGSPVPGRDPHPARPVANHSAGNYADNHADTHPAHAHAHSGTKGRPPRPPENTRGGLLMGRPFGVPVYVAPSWFLVAILITWVFGGQLDRVLPELGALRYLVSLFFAIAFYASVLVHELAHTVAALRFKLPVRRIQLQFFGGVSEIEKEAETPGREFVLAFVGPLLSLVLSGLFYLAMQPVEPGTVPGVLLAGLMISNLIVAAFNLLPGLPLDGGRMLRAVVWKITGKPMSGTIAAAWVGRALAVTVLIGLPLLTQSGALGSAAEDSVGMDTVMDALLAAILAAIIWTGAGNSLRMARLREHLPELRARTLTRRAVPVETDTPLSEALRRANDAGARALVVVDAHGEPVSLVREAAIVGVPEHRRPWVPVSGLAQDLTDGMRVSAELAGEDLLDALRATPATEYLVVEETGEIYGVLSAADVERAFVKAMARPS